MGSFISRVRRGIPPALQGGHTREFKTTTPTRFTRGGHKSGTTDCIDDDEPRKGWTSKGIDRFNELVLQVCEDRKKHRDAMVDWLQHRRLSNNIAKNTQQPAAASLPEATHELYDDDESVGDAQQLAYIGNAHEKMQEYDTPDPNATIGQQAAV